MPTSKDLPLIDIEAEPIADVSVDLELQQEDISAIHGEQAEDFSAAPDLDDPLVKALVQWLGRDKVLEMSVAECDALKNSLSRLPEPVPPSSFAWGAIKEPRDIRRVSEAVVLYSQFNTGAVAISEALGNNDEVRRIIRSDAGRPEQLFKGFVDGKRNDLARVAKLKDRIEALAAPFTNLFGKSELSIEATIVAVTAAPGVRQSLQHLNAGLKLQKPVKDDVLGEMDKLRRHIVAAADKVRRVTGINPMQYSLAVLSGVRRSLGEDATADYFAAIEGLGGIIEGDNRDIEDSKKAFLEFFQQSSAFTLLLTQLGLSVDEMPALLGNILARRHLMSAARTAGVPWQRVAEELSLAATAGLEEIKGFVEIAHMPGMTGQLKAVSKGKLQRPLADVARAAHVHIVNEEFWLTAAERVIGVQDDLRFVDLREVLRMEPEIDAAKKLLKESGANTSDDIEELHVHLEWMISAFALPISDEAVAAIIASKAQVIPMRLSN